MTPNPAATPTHHALFGGSFNPVHLGHAAVVAGLLGWPEVGRVILAPASRSPFKRGLRHLPDGLRLEMVRAAFEGQPRVAVSDLELRRGGDSYTVDTLRELAGEHPGAGWYLAMGRDAFDSFHLWREAREVARLACLVVVQRPGPGGAGDGDLKECIMKPWLWEWYPGADWDEGAQTLRHRGSPVLRLLRAETPSVSSTEIRNLARLPEALDRIPAGARERYAHFMAEGPPN